MTPFVSDPDFTLYLGDVREVLAELPDESVDCCVTSPPYWGLRDYGHDGQIGLEASPEAYVAEMVAVFAQVRRVLKPEGTLWLNLGDSYAGNRSYQVPQTIGAKDHDYGRSNAGMAVSRRRDDAAIPRSDVAIEGLKPKDLVGIPWAVARALQEPYYAGRIARERDRVWLAATIDAEGSICGFTHERADGDGIRTGVHITITNTSMALLAEAQRIWPTSRDDGNGHGISALGTRECRRWIAHNVDSKAALLRELYPYLIAKKTQALLAWNFLEMSREAKRIGKTAEGANAKERRAWIVAALSDLNHGREVEIPSWIVEPPTLYEPGWYLRSDIIWAKPNPMPESVTDRPTKAHEYVFLLTKSSRYFFDQEAVREPAEWARWGDQTNVKHEGSGSAAGWIGAKSKSELTSRKSDAEGVNGRNVQATNSEAERRDEIGGTFHNNPRLRANVGRNIRSVWEIATQPSPEAHFATFPEELPRRCIKAGCPAGGTVLDPFGGSGTTAKVARDLGRKSILVELNADYAALCAKRLQQLSLLADEVA